MTHGTAYRDGENNSMDPQLRIRLSQDLRRLVTGRITNDAFDDAYDEQYSSSNDSAIAVVAEFGYCLYSSDALIAYRLRGRHRLDRATRRAAARCVLFLRSKLAYEWPKEPASFKSQLLWALAFNLGLPGGIALLICSALPLIIFGADDPEFFLPIAAFGAFCLLSSVWYLFGSNGYAAAYNSPEWRGWRQAGDFDVWPFYRREDFYRARRTAFLLGCGDDQRLTCTD
jgi:hypothetical protein